MYHYISDEIVQQWQGVTKRDLVFNARQTVTGQWVVDSRAVEEFPEAFPEGVDLDRLVDLSLDDFPPDVLAPDLVGKMSFSNAPKDSSFEQ